MGTSTHIHVDHNTQRDPIQASSSTFTLVSSDTCIHSTYLHQFFKMPPKSTTTKPKPKVAKPKAAAKPKKAAAAKDAPAVVDKPAVLGKTKSGRVTKTTPKTPAAKKAAPNKKATPKKA